MDRSSRVRPRTYALALLVAGCGEPIRGDAALGDTPLVLAIRARVVEDGPHAEGLRAPPPQRWRAEILPADVVQVEALVASEAGEHDLDAHEALWFLELARWCDDTASAALSADDCSASDHVTLPCVIGRGASPQFVAPATYEVPGWFTGPLSGAQVCLVVGIDRPTDECAALLADGGGGLRPTDCAVAGVPIAYGPLLPWLDAHGTLPPSLEPEQVPPARVLELVAPDAGPGVGIVTFEIERTDSQPIEPRVVAEGETIVVPVGARMRIERATDPRDEQLSIVWNEGYFVGRRDAVQTLGWYLGHRGAHTRGGSSRWVWVPDEPTTFSLWAVVSDAQGNMGWARWTVKVGA